MRKTLILLWLLAILTCIGMHCHAASDSNAQKESRRAVKASTKVWITAGRFTLEELAEEIADPEVLKYENKVATLVGGFELSGPTAELVIGPGEVFRMEHLRVPEGQKPAPQQVLDRRMYLTRGIVDWKDCSIEGFYWININPDVSGTWDNVTFRVGKDHDDIYAPIMLGSSRLTWRGGTVDASMCTKVIQPHAPWVKEDLDATIEQVRFISKGGFLLPLPITDVQSEIVFTDCIFEVTEGAGICPWFHVEAQAADLGLLDITLIRPTLPDDTSLDIDSHVMIKGSTARLTVRRGEEENIYQEHSTDILSTSDSWHFESVCREVDRLSVDIKHPEMAKYEGLLWWPKQRLAQVEHGLSLSKRMGRFSNQDLRQWREILHNLSETLQAIPQMDRVGSRYCPRATPFPLIENGWARVTRAEDGTVTMETEESRLIYDPHGDQHSFASFTSASTIRGKPLMDVYPPYGAISIRTTGKSLASSLDGHYEWKTSVAKAGGNIAAMEAWIPGGASATMVIFGELPDVVLFDVNSNHVRYQAYAKGWSRKYNGQRIWNNDPNGIVRTFSREKVIPLSDPQRGVFLASEAGEWYATELAKGLAVMAWNGLNDWEVSPPCGAIIRKDEHDLSWTAWNTEYASFIVQINTHNGSGHPNLDDWQETSQVLYFEGRGLKCWENLFALDNAWNRPMELEPIILEPEKASVVAVRDKAGMHRPVEIVLLPKWCGVMQSDHDMYRGAHTILLLKDVQPHETVSIGRLPLVVAVQDEGRWNIQNHSGVTIPDVQLRLTLPSGIPKANQLKVSDRIVECDKANDSSVKLVLSVPPGETECRIVSGND